MLQNYGLVGGLHYFSVSPRPLGFGFGAKGLGPGLVNKTLFHDDGFHGCVEIWPRYFLTVFYLASALHVFTEPGGGDID